MEIKKIPLEDLINILVEIYKSGINFVDMKVEKHNRQDRIWFLENTSEAPPVKKEEKKELSTGKSLSELEELI
jgi:hypothetical protein